MAPDVTGVAMPLPRLALFHGRLGDSRLAEVEACAPDLAEWRWDPAVFATHGGDVGPSIVQPLAAEAGDAQLAAAAARAVSCRGAFEVWGTGQTVEACAAATEAVSVDHIRARITGAWRIESVVLGARRSEDGRDLGMRVAHLGHVLDALADRPVRLRGPAQELWLVEDHRTHRDGSALPGSPPRFLLLLRLPTETPDSHALLRRLDLRRRPFLSTTTLRVDRSLLLCNLGLAGAGPNATLLDPYCGSGSLLLAGAALGAATVGADIDWRMVSDNRWPLGIRPTADRPQRGIERVRMRDNFTEAGLPEPKALLALDMAAADAAAQLLEANGGHRYDAVVTDPPYGRREFQRGEAGWDGALTFKVHGAALGGTLDRLMALASAVLRPGGRLVFLTPVRSPRDPSKPTEAILRAGLSAGGRGHGLTLLHTGVEVIHGGLHRAAVVMGHGPDDPSRHPAVRTMPG